METAADVEPRAGAKEPGPLEALAVLTCWVALDRLVLRWMPVPSCLSAAAAYWAIGATRFFETVLLLGYWVYRERGLRDFGLTGPRAAAGFRRGVKWSLAVGALVVAAEALGRTLAGASVLKLVAGPPPRSGELAALVVVGGVVAPIFEELLFRGVLYQGFRGRFGAVPATVLSALVFASAHLSFQGVHPVQAAGGVLFAAAYELSGSLWTPLVLHVTGNVAIFLSSLLF